MKALRWTCLCVLFAFLVCGHRTGPGETYAAKPKKGQLKIRNVTGPLISPWDKAALQTLNTKGAPRDNRIQTAPGGDGKPPYIVFHMEFKSAKDCKNFKVDGTHIITRFERFADIFVRNDDDTWKNVLNLRNNLFWGEAARGVYPPPIPRSKPEKGKSKAIPDKIVRGGLGKLMGRGTIIVIVDTGLDFSHPDFIRAKNGKPESRLLYFWDTIDAHEGDKQEKKAPATYPNGAPIGALYTRSELTAKLQEGAGRFPGWDTQGHGTACASLAAGNNETGGPAGEGSKPKPVGVAPEADLIAVRVAEGMSTDNDYLLGRICEWVDEVAGKRPAVISCSFGGHRGGHDGNLVRERQISARFGPEVRGRAICVAAGNEAMMRLHGQAGFSGTQNGELKWTPDIPVYLALYFNTGNLDDVQLALPGTSANLIGGMKYINPISRQGVIELQVGRGQKGEMRLWTKSGTRALVDAYIHPAESGPAPQFDSSCAKASEQIGTPGTSRNAISVGSYDWNDLFHMKGNFYTIPVLTRSGFVPMRVGSLSDYSNPGYTRKSGEQSKGDRVTPDLVAPGQYFSAAAAQNAWPVPTQERPYGYYRETSGKYLLFNGTSAATPYAAGVIALIMEKAPKITYGQLKKLLAKHCQKDESTGDVPNVRWGNGKLNYKAVEKMIEELDQ